MHKRRSITNTAYLAYTQSQSGVSTTSYAHMTRNKSKDVHMEGSARVTDVVVKENQGRHHKRLWLIK